MNCYLFRRCIYASSSNNMRAKMVSVRIDTDQEKGAVCPVFQCFFWSSRPLSAMIAGVFIYFSTAVENTTDKVA
ncbi:hypothetical protein [Kistimonas asteriae]|uniref:hypothetical protein n=1 Tax=Kistimonas asteriae TaxID=517724 RepID=UPI001BA45E5F|nr:hypothetical protein [Kistimonas asteriae]